MIIIISLSSFDNNEKELSKLLNTDISLCYDDIRDYVDEFLEESIKFGNGIRILNQDLWEVLISFIISANNNIPRIKGIIERISKQYGKEVKYLGKSYYTFPTVEELSKASVQHMYSLTTGYAEILKKSKTKEFLGFYNFTN